MCNNCTCAPCIFTAEQKLKVLEMIEASIIDWRSYGDNGSDEPCIPASARDALKILFPKGM